MGESLILLQVVDSRFLWFYIQRTTSRYPFFLPVLNFPDMIDPTQIVRSVQHGAYSFPSPFPIVRF